MSSSLKRIDHESVHRICSGQVVLSLAVAVKELVENSLDAGATNIEVRLKEFGSELIEVTDNGAGVHPDNYQKLTLKHFTSKIKDFSDIVTIDTFGFRGEALSSLCALSNLKISTCIKGQAAGSLIEYDHSGKIKLQAKCAREVGTTVSLTNLFSTLPVRQKEFHRNLKKEYGRMIQMLQGYCVISRQVKLTCYNQTGKIKRQLVLSNSGGSEIMANISCIFGPRQTESIVPIVECPMETLSVEDECGNDNDLEIYSRFKLSGYVSKCSHGCGRSSTDRQFFFINGRPCDHSKLSKAVNEAYHLFNAHQYPFIVLNITTQKESVDVNVTPDKRQVMVQEEKALLFFVKASLLEMFKPEQRTVSTAPVNTKHVASTDDNKLSRMKRPLSACNSSKNVEPDPKQPCLTSFGITQSPVTSTQSPTLLLPPPTSASPASNSTNGNGITPLSPTTTPILYPKSKKSVTPLVNKPQNRASSTTSNTNSVNIEHITYDSGASVSKDLSEQHVISFDIDDIISRLHEKHETMGKDESKRRYFRAKIQPESNSDAEEELKRELNKEQFKRMEILGQFNLGFIVAKLDNDLFIIDQHATDEKHNFERLKRETVIEHQSLIHPLLLELTTVGESVVADNLEVFEKNGFRFSFDDEAPPTKRVKLIGQPVSKNWSMGPSEIEELIFLLSDYPGEMVRPHCVTKMLASRACRGSIMIGTALSKKEMSKIIGHMADMDQPWNCPHGRPTIRHLIDLSKLTK